MGNRKRRKELAVLVRLRGGGRLYCGTKKKAWHRLKGHTLRHMLHVLSFAPGDVCNDCDGYNHVIADYVWYRVDGCRAVDRLIFADGRMSCGCPYGPDPAWTEEQIAEFHARRDRREPT